MAGSNVCGVGAQRREAGAAAIPANGSQAEHGYRLGGVPNADGLRWGFIRGGILSAMWFLVWSQFGQARLKLC